MPLVKSISTFYVTVLNKYKNVKLSLCIIKNDMKKYGESEIWLHIFIASALDGGDWPASRPTTLPQRKYSIMCWMGSKLG
jgi:hypothetical protein